MLKCFCGPALLLCSSAALAVPTVTGNTIAWPDDGWYQVQDELTYTEICGGTMSCTVDPGSYVVINHSTGERFSGIVVSEPVAPAQVTVNGNVIYFPDDGWYSVLDVPEVYDWLTISLSQSYASWKHSFDIPAYTQICGGGVAFGNIRFCEVTDGTYLVIKDTTGPRVEVVVGQTSDPESPIVINGNTLSWPDDGWYQVQTSTTYESVCNGGTSCEVANGTYQVINHSTGQIYRNIVVSDQIINPPGPVPPVAMPAINLLEASEDIYRSLGGFQLDGLAQVVNDLAYITTQGTTIQWPDDDYYQLQLNQLQSAITGDSTVPIHVTVCEGETECLVLPGDYTVINLTDGERTMLTVPFDESLEQSRANPLPTSMFSYSDNADFLPGTLPVTWGMPVSFGLPVTFDIERNQFDCNVSGNVVLEKGNGDVFLDSDPALDVGTIEARNFIFDECRMTVRGGVLPNDSYLLNGTLKTVISKSVWRIRNLAFEGFSLVGELGTEIRADGQVVQQYEWWQSLNQRSVSIDKLMITLPSTGVSETITDSQFLYDYRDTGLYRYELQIDGTLQSTRTGNQQVNVTSASPLLYLTNNTYDPALDADTIAFNGTIEILAEDGSFLIETANADVIPGRWPGLSTDIVYTSVNGEQSLSERDGIRFIRFRAPFLTCDGGRDRETQRQTCLPVFSF